MIKVDKKVLIAIAGVLWTGVGFLLIYFASRWFNLLSSFYLSIALLIGLLLGLAISYFGFKNLAQKNIDRINLYEKKVCIWAFQRWQMFILIIFMISLGIFMRKSGLIPKPLLIPVYMGIGIALITASSKYYIFLYKYKKNKDNE